MTQTAEPAKLLDARIKGPRKFSGQWHPNKPVITFYPNVTYHLHPACYDSERFDLVKPGETPAAPAVLAAPEPQTKELPPRTLDLGQRPTEAEWRAAGYTSDPWPAHEAAMKLREEKTTPPAPQSKELPAQPRAPRKRKGVDA